MKKKESAAIQFIRLAWGNSTAGVPHSYERINHTMQRAVSVALGAFAFELGDWKIISTEFRSGYWLDTERCYTAAIVNGNTSAVASIEAYMGRTPLIADDVDAADDYQDRNTHGVGTRQKERLHVGAKFPWKGETVTVTSMSKDSATACSYTKDEYVNCKECGGYTSGGSKKLLHRYTITRDGIIAERAEQKRRSEIGDAMRKLPDDVQAELRLALAKLHIVSRADFNRAPLAKLEKVFAKFVEAVE
jgi:hypothetical protein